MTKNELIYRLKRAQANLAYAMCEFWMILINETAQEHLNLEERDFLQCAQKDTEKIMDALEGGVLKPLERRDEKR